MRSLILEKKAKNEEINKSKKKKTVQVSTALCWKLDLHSNFAATIPKLSNLAHKRQIELLRIICAEDKRRIEKKLIIKKKS